MGEHMHLIVLKAFKVVIAKAHVYVVKDWITIPLLLHRSTDGHTSHLTVLIMGALVVKGGMNR